MRITLELKGYQYAREESNISVVRTESELPLSEKGLQQTLHHVNKIKNWRAAHWVVPNKASTPFKVHYVVTGWKAVLLRTNTKEINGFATWILFPWRIPSVCKGCCPISQKDGINVMKWSREVDWSSKKQRFWLVKNLWGWEEACKQGMLTLSVSLGKEHSV